MVVQREHELLLEVRANRRKKIMVLFNRCLICMLSFVNILTYNCLFTLAPIKTEIKVTKTSK
jgi:hypothetical protein